MPTGTWPSTIQKGKNKGQPHPASGLDKQKYKATGELRKARKSRAKDPNRFKDSDAEHTLYGQGSVIKKKEKVANVGLSDSGPAQQYRIMTLKDAISLGFVADTLKFYANKKFYTDDYHAINSGRDDDGYAKVKWTGRTDFGIIAPAILQARAFGTDMDRKITVEPLANPPIQLENEPTWATHSEVEEATPEGQTNTINISRHENKGLYGEYSQNAYFEFVKTHTVPMDQNNPRWQYGKMDSSKLRTSFVDETFKMPQREIRITDPLELMVDSDEEGVKFNEATGNIETDISGVKSKGKKRQRAPRGSVDARKKGYEYYRQRYGREHLEGNTITDHIEHLNPDMDEQQPFWVAQQEEAQAKWGYGAPAPGSALKLNYQRTKLLDQYSPKLASFAEDEEEPEPVYAGGGGPAEPTMVPVVGPRSVLAPTAKKKKFKIKKPPLHIEPAPQLAPILNTTPAPVEEEDAYKLSSGYLKGYPLKGASNNRFSTLDLAIAFYKNADPGTKAKIGGITEAISRGKTVYELRKGKTLIPDAKSFSIIF